MYHKLLQKQIRKYFPDDLVDQEACRAFLDSINNSYESFERDRELMEHAFSISEKEFIEVNDELNSLADQRLLTLKKLNEIINSLLGEDESIDETGNLVVLSEKIKAQVQINKVTEEELSRNITLFKTLLANLQSGILIESEDRKILFTNQLFCSFFNVEDDPDLLVGEDWTESANHCKDLFQMPNHFVDRVNTLLQDRKAVYNEVMKTKEGRILERDFVPIYIEEAYRGHFWKYTDVTEKVHYQESLQESEERNRLVMNSSLDAIMISDGKGKVQYWNPRAEQMLGWTKEEAMGKPMAKFFAPDQIKTVYNAGMNRYLKNEISRILNRELELTAINKAGEELPVELVVVKYQQNGNQYFCGFLKDISTRKRSENRLKAQEEKYRNIIANMNLGLMEVDSEEKILFVNQSFCDISGYSAEELVGSTTDMFLHNHEDSLVLEQKKDLRAHGISDGYEVEVKNKSGETRWWFISGAPNYNDEGKLLGSIGIHLDITNQKQLESELAIAKDRAEEASIAKEAFLANMSHEIRTPLNAIVGMIRELGREELSPEQQTYLRHTDTAARHLLSIVNTTLDISKIEAGELVLEEHSFSLKDLVANITSILQIEASKKNIDLVSTLSDNIWPAYIGDPTRIRQILINLISNAIKFTEEGRVCLQIEALGENEAGQLLSFVIKDTGIGMDEAFLDQLFSKFSQAERSTSRRFGGTGLGMSITKELIKLMGGDIEVTSVKGQGTEFRVSLTLKKGDATKRAYRELDVESMLRGTRVLLVEDNVMNRFIVNKSLSHFGCVTTEAENGQIALELLKEKSYDLILMDIQMPELDGVATTKIIRNDLKLDLPILAITANAFKKDIDLYLSIGMNDYVTKPFEEKELFDAISRQLHLKAAATIVKDGVKDDYDLTQLLALGRGDEEFVSQMVEIFLEHTPLSLDEIQEALTEKDYCTIAKVAHRIKPSIKSMGITQLNGIARDIELAAEAENVHHDQLSAKIRLFNDTLSAVMTRLQRDYG